MERNVRRVLIALLFFLSVFLSVPGAFAQEDERPLFTDFNWFEIMKLDSVKAFGALWDHAAKYTAAGYDQKAILGVLLQQYTTAKELENLFPYDPATDAAAGTYLLTRDRLFGDRLPLPWVTLMKLNVRSAMQYILLEVLSTKGVPKSKGKTPTNWTVFAEYFAYYVVMKKAG